MYTTYLFQIDCAENNDAFFKTNDPAVVFYRGAGFQVGEAPWIPDGVRVDVEANSGDAQPSRCSLTIIEMEERRPEALKSSRKFLPEDSEKIVAGFRDHLQRKISECKSTGDSRESALIRLDEIFRRGTTVDVRTACALRSSGWTNRMEEDLPLIDQPELSSSKKTGREMTQQAQKDLGTPAHFRGTLGLDPEQARVFRRSLLILDAVLRSRDLSRATLHSWLIRAPLKVLLDSEEEKYPEVKKFIIPDAPQSGCRLDCEALLTEMATVWSVPDQQVDREAARRAIEGYSPTAAKLKTRAKMGHVFEQARSEIINLRSEE